MTTLNHPYINNPKYWRERAEELRSIEKLVDDTDAKGECVPLLPAMIVSPIICNSHPQRSKWRSERGINLAKGPDHLMLDQLKENNRAWAARMVSEDLNFFRRLERQQAPKYLWIGCSDSRVPANTIVGLDPGELFVHRNVANLASPQDANYLSVLQFAVDVIKVEHIMVVGHYGCGGVSAAVDGQRRGLVDHWLHPIREVYRNHRSELDSIVETRARLDRLCEFNVIRQVRNVASDVFVLDAWARGQKLAVHGWIYSISDGLIRDLNVTVETLT